MSLRKKSYLGFHHAQTAQKCSAFTAAANGAKGY